MNIKRRVKEATKIMMRLRRFLSKLLGLNKSNFSSLPVERVCFSMAVPNPIKRPNNYPAIPPVIPIMACPFFAIAIVVKPSGKAFPTAKIVNPR